MKNIEDNSCVKFRLATVMDKDWVEINSKEGGCKANVGFLGPGHGMHIVNLEKDACFSKGVIVHELLHILGSSHEQNRPDRDQYLTVNWKNMKVCRYLMSSSVSAPFQSQVLILSELLLCLHFPKPTNI